MAPSPARALGLLNDFDQNRSDVNYNWQLVVRHGACSHYRATASCVHAVLDLAGMGLLCAWWPHNKRKQQTQRTGHPALHRMQNVTKNAKDQTNTCTVHVSQGGTAQEEGLISRLQSLHGAWSHGTRASP